MSQIKIVSAPRHAQGNVKSGESLYGDLEQKIEKLASEGWRVIGNGPERDILIHKGWFIELLRKIPIINILINWIFPLDVQSTISVILQKD